MAVWLLVVHVLITLFVAAAAAMMDKNNTRGNKVGFAVMFALSIVNFIAATML